MERRQALTATGMILAATNSSARGQAGSKKPVVLVHGAGHGGWCWRDVRRLLQARGFEVFTPTLTGLGDRVHLRSRDIGLATHITDVVNLIEYEELSNVVLVGHSYAGMVVTGVVDAIKPRIALMIIIDGAVPEHGEPAFPGVTSMSDLEKRFGGAFKDGYLVSMNVAGLGFPDPNSPEHKWLKAHLTEHLAKTWIDTLNFKNGGSAGVPRTYIQCADPAKMSDVGKTKIGKVRNDPTWTYIEKLGPHNLMNADPAWTAEFIAARAA
ncbi:MAG: alpha/beta hydrolase [Alphaproteobacteria bacterium]|nr:alpha/beta hydrolase [Alphaproteobacteria bacterium]